MLRFRWSRLRRRCEDGAAVIDEAIVGAAPCRPVLHLHGAAPTIASSIAAAPSPQRRLNRLHRNRSILNDSSDEAEAYSAPPKRMYTHRITPSP